MIPTSQNAGGAAHKRKQQYGVAGAPAGRGGPARDALDLRVGEPGPARDQDVLPPLVAGTAQPAHSQDQDLALAGRKRRLVQDVVPEHQEALHERGVVGERAHDVGCGAAGALQDGAHGAEYVVAPLRRVEGWDAGL